MKKLLACFLLLVPLAASAQEGRVHYNYVVKYAFELPPAWEAHRDKIPSEAVTPMVLLFDEAASLMKAVPAAREAQATDGGGERMLRRLKMMSGTRTDNEILLETYIQRENGAAVETREFMGRAFQIPGPVPAYAWKLTGEASEFLGYPVHRATTMHEGAAVEAWFTTEIPVSAGPGLFGGLPGLILVASVDDGRIAYAATEVHLGDLEDGAIQAPEAGRRVERDAYEQIVAEKLKEVEALRRRGGDRDGDRRH